MTTDLVTRLEAAEILGVGKSTIRRHEAAGRLVPKERDPENGERRFRREDVEALRDHEDDEQDDDELDDDEDDENGSDPPPTASVPAVAPGPPPRWPLLIDGELAGRLFAFFAEGLAPTTVVASEGIPPHVVHQAWQAFVEMNATLVRGPSALERITRLEQTLGQFYAGLHELQAHQAATGRRVELLEIR